MNGLHEAIHELRDAINGLREAIAAVHDLHLDRVRHGCNMP
ncbi:MAG TPA: hypothetical protein VNN08_25985 [Thermoanaerobaculia bacterium]|nr:hypothetical protein [Thermoanaerobaculia bacterium]